MIDQQHQPQAMYLPKVDTLLSTKLTVPRLRAPLILRPSLLAKLSAGLDRKLTLISAPAGSGKTTLVSQWFVQDEHASDPEPLPRAWVALDVGDNDPVRFWRYIFTACQHFEPPGGIAAVGAHALALLTMPQPAFEAALTTFINEMAQQRGRHVLVLEDYHHIASPAIHELMLFLLDHLPETLHIILLTRHDPPLPLARLRTRHELSEIGAADLRFSLDETIALLQQSLPTPIAPDVVACLDARTEGWVAALRLVVLAVQGKHDGREIEHFLMSFSGGHGHVLEYLVEEVLHVQPAAWQTFLLQTVFLNRLTASLCNAVTGRNDSVTMLEQMERANLFLTSLAPDAADHAQQWYRYHGLFAEAMHHYARHHLDPSAIHALYTRASDWYEAHGLLGEAVDCAFASHTFATPASDADAHRRAAVLLEALIAPQLVRNEYHTLRRWLEQLPESVMRLHPQLCLTYAISILFTSERHSPITHQLLEPPLRWAEEVWRAHANQHKLGELLAFRSLVSWHQPNPLKAIGEARESLDLLPADDFQWRGIAIIFVGFDAFMHGALHVARQEMLQALALNQRGQNTYGTIDSLLLLGRICYEQGELRQAATYYEQARTELAQKPMTREQAEYRTGRALVGLGLLELEWNQLENAAARSRQAIEVSNATGSEDLRVEATLLLAETLCAQGQVGEAQTCLHALVAQTQQPRFLRDIARAQVRLALASGDPARVRQAQLPPPPAPLPGLAQEAETLLTARLQLAQGHAHAAHALVSNTINAARSAGRGQNVLNLLVVDTLAACATGEAERAKHALAEAITLAQPHGHQRVFLDGGATVAELLRALLREIKAESLVSYVRTLLLAFATPKPAQPPLPAVDAALLVEPLSAQERRVLRLLAADLSYPEIAGELVVSLNTVKTHVKNVYSKLDVHSRDEARDFARQLQLI